LKNTLLVYDSFNDVKALMDEGNPYAKEVIESWQMQSGLKITSSRRDKSSCI